VASGSAQSAGPDTLVPGASSPRRTLAATARGRSGIERVQNGILLFGRGDGEFCEAGEKFVDAFLELWQAFLVVLLIVTGESDESSINEVDGAGFAGAGLVVGGNDARSDGLDFDGLLRREEFKFCGCGGFGGLARVAGGGEGGGPLRGNPRAAKTGGGMQKKSSTTGFV